MTEKKFIEHGDHTHTISAEDIDGVDFVTAYAEITSGARDGIVIVLDGEHLDDDSSINAQIAVIGIPIEIAAKIVHGLSSKMVAIDAEADEDGRNFGETAFNLNGDD